MKVASSSLLLQIQVKIESAAATCHAMLRSCAIFLNLLGKHRLVSVHECVGRVLQ
jgi:hypothetical protein